MPLFGNAFTRSMTPTLNALQGSSWNDMLARIQAERQGAPSLAPNALAKQQQMRAYHPTPADRARNALASVLQSTGQLPGEARSTAENVVAFSPLGAADDFNSGLLQTGRGLSQGSKSDTLGGILAMALAAAPGPESPVFKRAADFRARLAELAGAEGWHVGDVIHSVNRHGESSAYIPLGQYQVRISDHPANMDFRPGQIDAYAHDADAFWQNFKADAARGEARRAAQMSERDAREAPFRDAWLASTDQTERGNIISKMMPGSARTDRQSVAQRWLQWARENGR